MILRRHLVPRRDHMWREGGSEDGGRGRKEGRGRNRGREGRDGGRERGEGEIEGLERIWSRRKIGSARQCGRVKGRKGKGERGDVRGRGGRKRDLEERS